MTTSPELDAYCFRLARVVVLMDEAGMADYRRWSRSQIASAQLELKCSVGRDEFRAAVQRHGDWLRSLSYDDYLRTGDWAVVRYFALRRSGYGCERCQRGRDLQAHHQTYERRCEERLDDLIVLCADCHADTHGQPPPVSERRGLRKLDPSTALKGVAAGEREERA